MRGVLLAAIVTLPVLAGCLDAGGSDGGAVAIEGVVETVDGQPIAAAVVTLTWPEGSAQAHTEPDGRFRFTGAISGACTLHAAAAGFLPATVALSCDASGRGTITLHAATGSVPGTAPGGVGEPGQSGEGPGAPPTGNDPAAVEIRGSVIDDSSGAPVVGALIRIAHGPIEVAARASDSQGRFEIDLFPGTYDIAATKQCFEPTAVALELVSDHTLELRLGRGDGAAPGAPTNLRAASGPGIGMASIAWDAPADEGIAPVHRFHVYRGGELLHTLGYSLAFGDHFPDGGAYQVAAVNQCGFAGPLSESVDAAGLATDGYPLTANPSAFSAQVSTASFAVLDEYMEPSTPRDFRIVKGTGNCCENYLATTPDGWILDWGGESIVYSEDGGASWKIVTPRITQLCGEGTVMSGPNGDILGVNWEFCLPLGGSDRQWSLKFDAASGQWLWGGAPNNWPFFDREYVGFIKGPFETLDGRIIPYYTFVFSNFHSTHGENMLISEDGVNYLEYRTASIDRFVNPAVPLPSLIPPDPDADWAQPIKYGFVRNIAPQFGLVSWGLLACAWSAPHPDGTFGCPEDDDLNGRLLVDSEGTLHRAAVTKSSIRWEWSTDVGRTWSAVETPNLAGTTSPVEWDFKVSAELDQGVVAVRNVMGPVAQDTVFRFRGFPEAPYLDEVLLVGDGQGETGTGGATSTGDRYDFMSLGFLPDGRVVLSYQDSTISNPAIAIEL